MSDDKMHDVRLVKHHIRRNKLDLAQHQAHLDTLEDCADMGVPTETRFQDGGTPAEAAEAAPAE